MPDEQVARPRGNRRVSEDDYRLTGYLGAPRLKAWIIITIVVAHIGIIIILVGHVAGGSIELPIDFGGQCHEGWSSGGECLPLWAGSRSGLSAAPRPLGSPYLPFRQECFQGERGGLREHPHPRRYTVVQRRPCTGQGHRHAVSSNCLRHPLDYPTEGTPRVVTTEGSPHGGMQWCAL